MEKMLAYVGTKLINAIPMNRLAYVVFRGWDLPANENGSDDGYLVEYVDSTTPNTEEYEGYVSWSPKAEFEDAYMPADGLPFGLAIDAIKKGMKIARQGWKGSGMFAFHVPSSAFIVNDSPLLGIFPEGTEIKYRAHMDLRNVDGSISTWAPSNSDTLATDWYIVK